MRNKLTTAIMLAAGAVALPAQADINKIIITQYVEGSGQNKAIELTNIGSEDHTFDDSVSLYQFGNGQYRNQIQIEGGANALNGITLAAGKSLVLAHGSADDAIGTTTTDNGGTFLKLPTSGFNTFSFNGDDPVYLGTTDDPNAALDIIGIVTGTDNRTSTWGSVKGGNQTLNRNSGITSQASTFDDSQWTAAASNTYTGLGVYPNPSTPTPTPTPEPTPEPTPPPAAEAPADFSVVITEYIEGDDSVRFRNNRAIELTNTGATDFVFDDSVSLYYADDRFTNQVRDKDGNNVLNGITIPAGRTLVIMNPDSIDRETIEQNVANNDGQVVLSGAFGDVRFNALNYTGNHAVFLAETGSSVSVSDAFDIVGIPGNRGDWGSTDVTLRRVANTRSATFSQGEWTAYAEGTLDGLGSAQTGDQRFACSDAAVSGFATPSIYNIQGVTAANSQHYSPLLTNDDANNDLISDSSYVVRGRISRILSGSAFSGLYIQDTDAPADNEASDSIRLVYNYGSNNLQLGQEICVVAQVSEASGTTVLTNTGPAETGAVDASAIRTKQLEVIESDYYTCPAGVTSCENNNIVDFSRTLARYEGTVVTLPADLDATSDGNQTMVVARPFGFDFETSRSNMALAYNGILLHPNQNAAAGTADSKFTIENNVRRNLTIESLDTANRDEMPYFEAFATAPQDNLILVGDRISGLEGTLVHSNGLYRLVIDSTQKYTVVDTADNDVNTFTLTREKQLRTTPTLETNFAADELEVRVASVNVLNYFNSPYGGTRNPNSSDNRGADNADDFALQQDKLVRAIRALDADVIGMMEIENNGMGDNGALATLLDEVNLDYDDERFSNRDQDDSILKRYRYIGIDSNNDLVIDYEDTIGSDAITNALVYRPTALTLRDVRVIQMPNQNSFNIVDENGDVYVDNQGRRSSSGRAFQRDALVATFVVNHTGKLLTVAVNHLKSKGSNCADDWDDIGDFKPAQGTAFELPDPDFQGQCERFRSAAAVHLAQELDKIAGDKMIIGDLNSYASEDAMLVLTEIPAGKEVQTARDTFIGNRPQFGGASQGIKLSQGYGYINAVKKADTIHERETSYSYIFDDYMGSLDHALVSKGMEDRIKDAIDWNINSIISAYYDYSSAFKNNPTRYHQTKTPYRSSDHDPVVVSLAYKYFEQDGNRRVQLPVISSRVELPFVYTNAEQGDVVQTTISAKDSQDISRVTITRPTIETTVTGDTPQSVMLTANDLPTGRYTIRQVLLRNDQEVAGSAKTLDAIVASRDSEVPGIITPEYDGSGGGGHMAWWMLALAGLMLGRRNVKA
ncbi:MAG: ExeM/NucH family extracellular endonuclease [Saccharospirillaceae bacterium]|nr:ExeM/NucH family extracellular endonuclease [Saccharospirillaceae bacterium]